MVNNSFWEGLLFIVLVNGISVFFGSSVISSGQYYLTLNRPKWAPPRQIFGIVWPILYSLMGYSTYRIYRERSNKDVSLALGTFFIQLVFNVIWTPVFFGGRNLVDGLFIIALLLPLIFWNIFEYWRIDTMSGLLLIPYFLWILLASQLSLSLLRLNYCGCCACSVQEKKNKLFVFEKTIPDGGKRV